MHLYEGKPGRGMSLDDVQLPPGRTHHGRAFVRVARPLFVKPHKFTSRTAWLAVVAFWLIVIWAG